MTEYISDQEIYVFHAAIIEATGGSHGVRDSDRIASMVARPMQTIAGKELYPTLFEKAAVYFEVPAFHHPFIDGNKRTAITVAIRFLEKNGFEIAVSDEETEIFVLDAVEKKYDIQTIATWFKKSFKKMGEKNGAV